MEPLTPQALATAQRQWQAHGPQSYHLVVRIRAPKFKPALYDVTVASRTLGAVERNGEGLSREDAERHDYSMPGLFELLRADLRLIDVAAGATAPPIDLRAQFDPETGRLVRYRRTVGAARRRVLWVEVIGYEPLAPSPVAVGSG